MKLPQHIRLIILTYLSGIFVFGIFRLLLLLTQIPQLHEIPAGILFYSFWMGVRFDTVISGYFLILPALILSIVYISRLNTRFLIKIYFIWISVFYSLAFLICSIDIPYYNHFGNRLTVEALTWADNTGFVLSMIFHELKFVVFIIPFLLFSAIFIYINFRFKKSVRKPEVKQKRWIVTSFSLILLLLLLVGIRGRVGEKSPIRTGTAYFSNFPFANHLGLNPVFTFFRSFLDKEKYESRNFMPFSDEKAIQMAKNILHSDCSYKSPIARYVNDSVRAKPYNIVLILMEGISANYLQKYGSKEKLMPFLDSLMNESFVFDNFYSAGIHTYNGVFSTLFSYPAILANHPMKTANIPQYNGLSYVLKQNNYTNIYFTTHDDQFDNIGGFLKNNFVNKIISKDNYPTDEIKSTLGVTDDFMFRFSFDILNKEAEKSKFFAMYLTASNHEPIIVPENFQKNTHFKEPEKQIKEFTDYSIRRFIQKASQQPWFDSTIFVITSDHGAALDHAYDISLAFHHIPLIIYAPMIIKPGVSEQLSGQIDVASTILGLLHINYLNNNFGMDAMADNRRFAYFCSDNRTGVIDNGYFLQISEDNSMKLFRYRNYDTTNYIKQFPQLADSMKNYAFSLMQTASFLHKNNLTFEKNAENEKHNK